MTLRFSNLARLEACPASLVESEGMPSVSGADAQRGTSKHALLAAAIDGAPLPEDFGITFEEIGAALAEIVPGAWQNGKPVSLDLGDGVVVTGTPDLTNAVEAAIVDWKDEHQESTHPKDRIQLLGYAVAVASERMTTTAKAVLFSLPQKLATVHAMDAAEIQSVKDRIRSIAVDALAQRSQPIERRKYAIGEHCGYCPARPTCPALAATRREALALVQPGGAIDLPREKYPWLYGQLRGIKKACDEMMSQLKTSVEADGPAEGDGQVLRISSTIVAPSRTWAMALGWLKEWGYTEAVERLELAADALPGTTERKSIHLGKLKEAKR